MMVRVGQRVTHGGRTGTVVALRPQGMVDVRFNGRVERRSGAQLRADLPIRRNGRHVVGDQVQHNDGRTGTVVRHNPPHGYTVHWHDTNRRTEVHHHYLRPHRGNPGSAQAAANEYVTIVANGIVESAAAKGKNMPLRTAFMIATKQLQKYGYLEPGTRTLTAKGRAQAIKKAMEPDAALRRESIEYMLAGGRKAKGYRVVPVGKQFEVRPGGKRFCSEAKAHAYAQSLGTVDTGTGEKVRRAAQIARGERKALEAQAKHEARQLQLDLGPRHKQIGGVREEDGRFYITGTTKWFSTRAKANAYLRKKGD